MENLNEIRAAWLTKAEEKTSGCPLFEGRDKGDLNDMEGEILTLQRAWPLTGDKGNYFAIWVEEVPELFYLTGSALTSILEDAQSFADDAGVSIDQIIEGTRFKILQARKTKNGNKFRPIEIVTE